MLKLQYFGHIMQRDDSLEKTLMLGNIEGRRRRGQQRMRWLDGIIDSMDMGLSKLWEMVKDREAWRATLHGAAKIRTWLSNWTELNWFFYQRKEFSYSKITEWLILWYGFVFVEYQLCLALGTPGFPVNHRLPELTQTHVHRVGDAIQPSHSLLSPSPPTFSLSQHQGLFQWTGSSHQVAKVLALQLQNQSFQWIFRTDFLRMDSNSLLDLLVVQGTLKSLPQHHSLKVSVL